MTNETEHDDMLFQMLKECKTLPVFMDHVFGFLQRRSDFYVVSNDASSPVGLGPGIAEALVRQTFMKYVDTVDKNSTKSVPNVKKFAEGAKKKSAINIQAVDPSRSFNGASFDNYSWSQTYNEVDLFLNLPENIAGRDLIVDTTVTTVCIKLKIGTILLEGSLCHPCKLHPIWSIDGKELLLHLEKSKEIWWDCFLTKESKIDISKIECTKPMEDLSEDAQAKIHELQWNQEQRLLGHPTSDQIGAMNTLRNAWNVEGSPFSGPFDPNVVSLG